MLLTQDDVVEKNVAMLFNRAHRRPYLLEKKTSPPTKRFPRVSAAFAIEKLIRAVSGLDSVPIRRLFLQALMLHTQLVMSREQ